MNELREKIEQLAKGRFEYQSPNIVLSEENISLYVEAGKAYEGSFLIKNEENTTMKGVVYSSHERLKIKTNKFVGNENRIEYEFSADYLSAGERVKGEISIVSNCGEITIPFTCEIEIPYCVTTTGKIRDLFEFTNLAKEDLAQALKIFKSKEFVPVFLDKDNKNQRLYYNLVKSRNISQALEEFLIAVHKKTKMNLSVDKINLYYEIEDESIMDSIQITKDNWGYEEIRIIKDADFIELDHKIIWTDNFLGSNYKLEFVLNPKLMRNGNNFSTILLKTVHQTITIQVFCKCNKNHLEKTKHYHDIKLDQKALTTNYLEFRKNNMTAEQYVEDTSVLIKNLSLLDHKNLCYDLLQIHLSIISGNHEKAKEEIVSFVDQIEELKEKDITLYCGYLYLNALLYKQDDVIKNAVDTIHSYYKENDKFELLWFLLYLDKKYDTNKQFTFIELKRQFEKGCHSPILYYEAYSVIKEDPSLLYELGLFEIQLMHWCAKNMIVSEEVAMQFTYLANREKRFNRVIFQALTMLYEKKMKVDILSALCSMLIKGHKNANKYFKWYSLGVSEQLRITELYEYYMYSLDESKEVPLPQQILLYFMYNNSLGDKKKAYLYSYIIKNRENNAKMYQSYLTQIEQFAYKQLKLHNISNSLAVIYEDILKQDHLNEEMSKYLSNIIFQHEISCTNQNIKGVFVNHKELQEEIYLPLIDGHAKFNIFTEDVQIFLVDTHDNRYIKTIDYTLNKFMHIDEYIYKCFELNKNNMMLILHTLEKEKNYHKDHMDLVRIQKSALEIPNLKEDTKRQYLLSLIHYYYQKFEGDMLEAYFLQLDIEKLTSSERNKLVEAMILRDVYEKAYETIKVYGYEGINTKALVKLCKRLIEEYHQEKNELLVAMSAYVFFAGETEEVIVHYLIKYYSYTTKAMLKLYQIIEKQVQKKGELEERLLGQILFSESCITDSKEVFASYYKIGSNHKLIRAYLSYHAYKYIRGDMILDKEFFDYIIKEVTLEENEICMVALLKFYSEKTELTKEECDFALYNLNKLIDKGIILPFFKNFKSKISIPECIRNVYIVEYKGNPNNKVLIHYRIDRIDQGDDDNAKNHNYNNQTKDLINHDDNNNNVINNNVINDNIIIDNDMNKENYQTEVMEHAYCGIFIKEFVLFYNERLTYFITQINEDEEISTQSVQVKLDDSIIDEVEETKYNQINLMLVANEIEDDKTLFEMMDQFVTWKYLSTELFKPI